MMSKKENIAVDFVPLSAQEITVKVFTPERNWTDIVVPKILIKQVLDSNDWMDDCIHDGCTANADCPRSDYCMKHCSCQAYDDED